MRKGILKTTFILFFALFFGVSGAFSVYAQSPGGVKLEPSIIEERVDPGDVIEETLRATNLSESERTFYVLVRNISGLTSTGAPIFSEFGETTPYELSSWVEVSEDPIIIGAGDTASVPYTIRVPEDASPGGHYGGIFLTLEAVRPDTLGAGVGYQVGSIINLRIAGQAIEEARVREFIADKNIYKEPNVNFTARIENEGNVIIRPRGPIDIIDMFGNKVDTVNVNESAAAVFPQSERVYQATWSGESFSIGRYRAIMGLVYGEDGRKTISSVVSFWVLPLNVLVPVIVTLIVLVLVVFVGVRLYVRRKLSSLRVAAEGMQQPPPQISATEGDFLDPRVQAPFSRLALTTIMLLIFTLVFLMLLFFFFA